MQFYFILSILIFFQISKKYEPMNILRNLLVFVIWLLVRGCEAHPSNTYNDVVEMGMTSMTLNSVHLSVYITLLVNTV